MWRWLYPRLGQTVCFTAGGLLLGANIMDATTGNMPGGAILIATGLALKALAIWRERRNT